VPLYLKALNIEIHPSKTAAKKYPFWARQPEFPNVGTLAVCPAQFKVSPAISVVRQASKLWVKSSIDSSDCMMLSDGPFVADFFGMAAISGRQGGSPGVTGVRLRKHICFTPRVHTSYDQHAGEPIASSLIMERSHD
jgi:hypothetical protein